MSCPEQVFVHVHCSQAFRHYMNIIIILQFKNLKILNYSYEKELQKGITFSLEMAYGLFNKLKKSLSLGVSAQA